MISWKLWRALKRPPLAHPLYQRTLSTPLSPAQINRRKALFIAALIILYIAAFAIPLPPAYQPTARALSLIIPGLILAAFFFSATAMSYGLLWATAISSAIASAHERRTYDLLCVAPSGEFGALWAICTACLHRRGTFQTLLSATVPGALVIVIPLALLATILISELTPIFILYFALIVLAVYIDYVYSAILSSLVGIAIPFFMATRLDARTNALLAFLFLQTLTYLITALVGLVILPALLMPSRITDQAVAILIPIITFLTFFGVREILTILLWQALTSYLPITSAELNAHYDSAV